MRLGRRENIKRGAAVAAVVLAAVILLPALFLATYDHEGDSPLGQIGGLVQLGVALGALGSALVGARGSRLGATLISFVLIAGWWPLTLAFVD